MLNFVLCTDQTQSSVWFCIQTVIVKIAAPDEAVCGYASMTALPSIIASPHTFTLNSAFSSVL